MEIPAPDAASYIRTALELGPHVRQFHQEIERDRTLPTALVTSMNEAGFFSLWLSRAVGGPELNFIEAARVIEALSCADGAAGWCATVSTVFSRLSGFLAADVARGMFGDGRSRLAGSVNPTGKAVAVQGGFQVSGRWSYGSFIRHSDWTVGNSIVHDDQTPRRDSNGAPDIRSWIIPTSRRRDHRQLVSLPAARHRKQRFPGPRSLCAGNTRGIGVCRETRPTWDAFTPSHDHDFRGIHPMRQHWNSAGGDRRVRRAGGNQDPMGSTTRLRDKPSAQAAIGRAEAILRSGRAFLFNSVTRKCGIMWRPAEPPPSISAPSFVWPPLRRPKRRCKRLICCSTRLVELRSLKSNSIGRCFRDVHATTQHIGTNAGNYSSPAACARARSGDGRDFSQPESPLTTQSGYSKGTYPAAGPWHRGCHAAADSLLQPVKTPVQRC